MIIKVDKHFARHYTDSGLFTDKEDGKRYNLLPIMTKGYWRKREYVVINGEDVLI